MTREFDWWLNHDFDHPRITYLVIYHPERNTLSIWVKAYDIGGAPNLQECLDIGWEVIGEV